MFLCLLKNKVVHCIWTGKTQINTNNFHTDMKKRSVERKKLGRGFKSFTGLSLDFSTQTYGNLAIIFFLHASTLLTNTMNNSHQLIMKSMICRYGIYVYVYQGGQYSLSVSEIFLKLKQQPIMGLNHWRSCYRDLGDLGPP